jgi:hypothetical protein
MDDFATSFLQNLSEKNIKCEYNKIYNYNYRPNYRPNTTKWISYTSSEGQVINLIHEKIEEPSYIWFSRAEKYQMLLEKMVEPSLEGYPEPSHRQIKRHKKREWKNQRN